MDTIIAINDFVNDIVWGIPIIILILGTGIFLTIRTGFVQFRHIGFVLKKTLGNAFSKEDKEKKEKLPGEITPFQAAMVSISAIVGSGNIAGVATAMVLGGPGALFWMVVAAFIGMATKFSEITLGVHYRKVNPDGSTTGGPMYYIETGLKSRWLGIVYAVLVIFVSFGISAIVDSNTMAAVMKEQFNVDPIWSGIVFAALTAVVVFGGVTRIGQVCEKLSPFMGGAYILAGLLIIILNITRVPGAIVEIFQGAFNPQAITGGAIGSVFISMRYGMARGMFSNEAGLGTTAMVHAGAKTKHAVEQGLWGPVEVFLDTVVLCTISALAIILSGLWKGGDLEGAALTMRAFDTLLPGKIGGYICLGAVLLFGYSCLVTFYVYVERAVEFIFKTDKLRLIVRVVWVAAVVFGAVATESFAWDLADTFNGIMIFPNLIALLLLSSQVGKLKKDYFDKELPLYYENKKATKG